MTKKKPYVLTIAGFDPSAGAGILADIKTFEQNNVYGFGAVSALTLQNDINFEAVDWMSVEKIINQVAVLIKRFDIKYIKIGLIENFDVLQQLVNYLNKNILNPVILFDPILKASAGFEFHSSRATISLNNFEGLFCITPNLPEAINIWGENNLIETLEALSHKLNIYLKGGHGVGETVTDYLFTKGDKLNFTKPRLEKGAKHGSGCVISAALTANLALGFNLEQAVVNAKNYTYQFLGSNDTLLGYHKGN